MKLHFYPDIILLKPCMPVDKFDEGWIGVLDHMHQLMIRSNGMGLAANQVGLSKQLFIMKDKHGKIWEFFNPRLSDNEGQANLSESCLSAPSFLSKIHHADLIVPSRAEQVTVTAQDRNGEGFVVVAFGIEAVCVQHEYDHLQGEFFFDKLANRDIKRRVKKAWEKTQKKLKLF